MNRRTVARTVSINGLGLFTGAESSAVITPASEGEGIAFEHKSTRIPTHIAHLSISPIDAFKHLPARHTCLAINNALATTTEHLLAALAALGITDATITLADPGEVPIDDGSALSFVREITNAGTTELEGAAKPITITETISVSQGDASITIEPAQSASYTYIYEPGSNSPLERQAATWDGSPDDFITNIAPARTFSFEHEAEQMQSLGLFTAFTPRDLLVLDERGVPIDNQLRFDNEPARHKLLDLIGDLALAGAPLIGKVTATKSGHALNHEMARKLAEISS
ncbi:MAG: UDP-3-O-[3-hydroxymyristoyl] N-acetylglucosamine deacetylase [Phycisphaera sp.]|nr:MAG: UDP-3-O-[3-hydroxymyristoyl] N-acetylglucosamine deacetylase [Phycisphaera sp.]